jgi:transposase
MEKVATIGLDLAQHVFQVHATDEKGRKLFSPTLLRSEVTQFFRTLSPCVVAMEATGSAHFWAREVEALGHRALLIPAQYVKPFVKRGKTDALDAEAIGVAAVQEGMQAVRIKTSCQYRSNTPLGKIHPALTPAESRPLPLL